MEDWLEKPKTVLRWSGLKARPNHAGHLIGVGELAESGTGITIPGFTLQIEVKAPCDVARCLYLFSIMHQQAGDRRRAYQLEVSPAGKRTHNGDDQPIHGPHEHVDDDVFAVSDLAVKCENWPGVLHWFFTRTHIEPFEIPDPNRDGL